MNLIAKVEFMKMSTPQEKSSIFSRRRRRVSTPGQTQTGLGRGFILLLPQTAVLPESDAGSGVVKLASSFVIQNHQTSCSCGARCIGHAVRT